MADTFEKAAQKMADDERAQEARRYARQLGSETKEDADELSVLRGMPEYKEAWQPEFDRVMAGGKPYEPGAGLLGTYTPPLARDVAADDARNRPFDNIPPERVRALAAIEAGEAARYLRERNKTK